MRRISLVFAAVATLALAACGGYWAYWRHVESRVTAGIERWAAERRSEGYAVAYGKVETGGFPGALTLRVAAPQLARGGELPFAWQAEALAGEVQPWSFERVAVFFPGAHALRVAVDGQPRDVQARLGVARADIGLARGEPQALRLAVETAEAHVLDTGETFTAQSLHLVAQRLPAASPTAAWLDADARLGGLVLPEAAAGPLGKRIESIVAVAALIGALPPGPPAHALAQWRDANGYVELRNVELKWGALEIKGAGTARLDANLQPVVHLDSRLRGWNAVIDALVAVGQLRPHEALLARNVLGALARPAEDGGGPVLRLAVSVRDSRLFIGPVRIARLRQIRWP